MLGADLATLETVVVHGSDQADNIDLRGFTRERFARFGSATITAGGGDDIIFGSDLGDLIEGGDGNDSVSGGLGDDAITAGAGNDTLDGGAGGDTLTAQAGRDELTGGNGFDLLHAGDNTWLMVTGTANASITLTNTSLSDGGRCSRRDIFRG